MKLTPKLFLGVLIILFLTSLLFFLIIFKSQSSISVIIDSKQNKFTINFQIDKKKTTEFEKFLENIEIPYQVEKGITFQLDATSSTYLNLLTPIKIDLDTTPKKINFKGASRRPVFLKGQTPDQIHPPQNTNLAIFAPNLSGFITSRSNFPPEVENIFENTVHNDSGHYLLIFGSKPSYGLFFKKEDFNLSGFKEIPKEASSEAIEKENQDKITQFYLLTPDTAGSDSDAGVLFDLGAYKVFASSPDAANEIINAQNTSPLVFPNSKENNTSFVLEFKNNNEPALSDDFYNFILNKEIGVQGGQEKIKNSLSKIRDISITLKGNTFSGLINTK